MKGLNLLLKMEGFLFELTGGKLEKLTLLALKGEAAVVTVDKAGLTLNPKDPIEPVPNPEDVKGLGLKFERGGLGELDPGWRGIS